MEMGQSVASMIDENNLAKKSFFLFLFTVCRLSQESRD